MNTLFEYQWNYLPVVSGASTGVLVTFALPFLFNIHGFQKQSVGARLWELGRPISGPAGLEGQAVLS